jgi:hypothetical protein
MQSPTTAADFRSEPPASSPGVDNGHRAPRAVTDRAEMVVVGSRGHLPPAAFEQLVEQGHRLHRHAGPGSVTSALG